MSTEVYVIRTYSNGNITEIENMSIFTPTSKSIFISTSIPFFPGLKRMPNIQNHPFAQMLNGSFKNFKQFAFFIALWINKRRHYLPDSSALVPDCSNCESWILFAELSEGHSSRGSGSHDSLGHHMTSAHMACPLALHTPDKRDDLY